jgi:hypothetical protein
LALDIRILSGNDQEIQIKDIDYELNEKEKARELGVDIPETVVGGPDGYENIDDEADPDKDIDVNVDDIDDDLGFMEDE